MKARHGFCSVVVAWSVPEGHDAASEFIYQAMATEDYLRLRTVRLRPLEEWSSVGCGLGFVLGRAGRGRHVLGMASQPVGAGDVLVLNRGSPGKLIAEEGAGFEFGGFGLCPEHLFPLCVGPEIALLQRFTDGFKGAKVYPAASETAQECQRLAAGVPPQFDLAHRSQVLRVAAAILSAEFKRAQRPPAGYVRIEEHMLQVFERLSTNELLYCSVAELAAKFGCSRRHLNRLFHQHFGISVAALKMEMRLLKAVSLLRNPDAKVIRVAEECGFNHLGLFNICFKRRFGTSPGQWRRRALGSGNAAQEQIKERLGCPLRVGGLCPQAGGPGTRGQSRAGSRPAPPEQAAPDSPAVIGYPHPAEPRQPPVAVP